MLHDFGVVFLFQVLLVHKFVLYSREAEENGKEFASLSPVLAEPVAQNYMQKVRLTSEELFQSYFQNR